MTTLANINITFSNFYNTEDANNDDDDNDDDDPFLLPLPWLVVTVMVISVAIVTAVGGNLLVLLSYRRDRGLRDVHNLYLLHLAVCDLMIGAFSMPFYLIYTAMYWKWPLGRAVCKFFLVEDFTASCMSSLVVVLVAADRLALIRLGIKYQVVETRTRAYMKLAVCWICAFLLYSPAIIFWDLARGYSIVYYDGECDVEYYDNMFYVVITEFFGFVVPFIFLTVINTRMFMELKKRRKTGHKSGSTCGLHNCGPSALTNGREHETVENISDSSCELTKKKKKPIQNIDTNDCDKVTPLDVPTPEMPNNSSTHKAQISLLPKTTPLNDQTSIELSNVQTTDCSRQPQAPTSAQSDKSRPQSQKAVHLLDAAVFTSGLQSDSLSRPADSTSPERISPRKSYVRPSILVSGHSHTTNSGLLTHQNHQAQQVKDKRQRRVAIILTGQLLAMVIFWLPYSVTTILLSVCEDCLHDDLYEFFVWLLWIKSCVNPFLYAYNSPRFRRNFQELLSHLLPARLQTVKRKSKTGNIGHDQVPTIHSNLSGGEH